jgi:hypothetical protein
MQIIDTRTGRIWYNSQEKQTLFHNLIDTRAETGLLYFLYGGAAKGGKSEALRHQGHSDALTYSGIKILLIRSQLTELKRTHIRRVYQDIPRDWFSYNKTDHLLTYKNGSLMEFGFFDRPENLNRYLSTEYDVILIDELTTIPFEIFLLLTSRLAASRADFIPYIACATNPGEIAHREVKSYFIDKDFDIEFPELIPQEEEKAYDPDRLAFIPATIHDNPILIKRDPGILKRLRSLPPKERKRFYEGSWDIFEGQFFDTLNRLIHHKEDSEVPTYSKPLAAMDYGNFAVCYYAKIDNKSDIYITHEWVDNDKTKEVEDKALSFKEWCIYNEFRDFTVVCDTDMFASPRKAYGGEKKVVDVFRRVCKGLNITFVQVAKVSPDNKTYRVYCNRILKDKFNWVQDPNGLWLRKPKMYINKNRCKWFWKTVPALIVSKQNDEDIDQTTGIDHPYDATKMLATSAPSVPLKEDKESTEEIKQMIADQMRRNL